MPIDWKDPSMTDRLLAALLATSGGKIDYKKVAHYFGHDTTYDTIHSRFRKAINESKRLVKEADGRETSAVVRGKKGNVSPSKTASPTAMNDMKKRVNISKGKTERATKKARTGEESNKEEIHMRGEDADIYDDNSDNEEGFGSAGIEVEI